MTFALELYRTLAREPGNLFCSPYSIEAALAMVAAGAAGQTLDQLVRLLGQADPVADHASLRGQLATRTGPDVALVNANSFWHQSGYDITPGYLERLKTQLHADARAVDFAGDARGAAAKINAWASEATRKRITNVVAAVPPTTRVILANAVYFKALWQLPFDPGATRPRRFITGGGEGISVPTMARTLRCRYAKLSAIEAIELPYRGNQLAMVIIVPPLDHLAELERVLDLDRVMRALKSATVELQLPRFRIESSFGLGDALLELGLGDMFSGRGDFSPLTTEPGFLVDEVVHKTFVEVDEVGTEAAAVTATMLLGSARPPAVIPVHIDRPFIFAIRDLPTNTTLFIGRVEDPR